MADHIHHSEIDVPVLPPTLPTLPDLAATDAARRAVVVPAGPRPIVISPTSAPSSSAPSNSAPSNSGRTSRVRRTTPISAPVADMSTPAHGVPRLAPSVSPVLAPSLPASVTSPEPTVLLEPELVEVVAAVVELEESRFITDEPPHPMAHLMPPRTKPTEAQQRAAELRASRKKKSRRIKLVALVATVALGVLAGPPLVTWVTDAVNESGDTTDEPSTTDGSTSDNTSDGTADVVPATGVGTLLDDIDTLTSVVTDNNATPSGG